MLINLTAIKVKENRLKPFHGSVEMFAAKKKSPGTPELFISDEQSVNRGGHQISEPQSIEYF
jgi:hypothetical protein